MARFKLLAPLLALGLLASCRNPFNPSSDASLMAIGVWVGTNSFLPEIHVQQVTGTLTENNFDNWRVTAQFLVRNRVGVNLRSVNIVYTNMQGQAVTAYGVSGKTFKLTARLMPVAGNTFPYVTSWGRGVDTSIPINVVDLLVYNSLASQSGDNKVILAHVTFWGEDDNGYDVKLSSNVTIKGYAF